ncbi:MAG: GHKL domain-containing protein [Lachnospiraceae bacterium]|nr:GHKL domain-containing protein [Lachnospiraceae bacterium]
MYDVGLSASLYLVSSIVGGIYIQKFLRGKYKKKFVLFAWTSLYFIIQSVVLDRIDCTYPLRVLTNIAVVLLLLMLLYNKDFLKQLFVAVSFVAGKEIIIYIIVVINYGEIWVSSKFLAVLLKKITTMKESEMWICIFNVTNVLVLILFYTLLLIVYFSIISRKFVRKDYQFKKHEYTFLILPNVSTLCISITIRIMILSVKNSTSATLFQEVPATMFWVPFICFLLLGVNISSVMLFQKLVQLGEEEQKRAILENQTVQMQREIEEIQDIYADMRGLRHDMKSQLESIAAVIRRISGKDKEELDNYIEKMETTVSRLDFAYSTGNPITDVIIHQKKQEAEKQNISFEADFIYPDKQQIDVYDIGIVLNNALENAIEASSKVDGKKSINLHAYMKGNLFFIEVENDFSSEIMFDSETGLPISSKADKQLHGLGMENIQRCARKYMGDIDITIHNTGSRKKFNLTVMMNGKPVAAI